MILIEILTPQGQRLEKEILHKDVIRVGRHSSNDVVVPDIRVPLHWFDITKKDDDLWEVLLPSGSQLCSTELEIPVDPFRIRIVNLNWLDQQPHRSLLPNKPSNIKQSVLHSWTLPLWFLFNFCYLFYVGVMSSDRKDWLNFVEEFLVLNLVLLIPTLGLSILSQAVNKQYRFRELLQILVIAAFAASFLGLNFFGFRWLLPEWVQYKVFTAALQFSVGGYFLYLISQIIFDHIKKVWRIGIISSAVVLAIFISFQKYLPIRNQFQFMPKDDIPLLYPLFDNSAENFESLISKLDQQLTQQTERAEKLKHKMKKSESTQN